MAKMLSGVVTAMATPFDVYGNVSTEILCQLTAFLMERDVNGLYPCGTTGEMLRMSIHDRKVVAETVVYEAGGQIPVFIHVGAMNQEDTLELALHAQRIGADGIGIVTPQFFYSSDSELETYYIAIAKQVENLPIYLYNIPQCSANDLSPQVCERIRQQCPNVVGIKYSFPDMARTMEYLAVDGGRFSVLQGIDKLFASCLVLGCNGTVSGCSTVMPEPFVALYKAYQKNDLQEVIRLQKLIARVCTALHSGINLSFFKEALAMRGIKMGAARLPQQPLSAEESANLRFQLDSICTQAGIRLSI